MLKMVKLGIILVALIVQIAYGHYQGPFLLWGVENLNDMKIPALQAIDNQNLREIYTKASAIVIFIRNATTKLSYENFPELSDIIGKNEWLYLPQEFLSSDPFEYNVNAEVFTLTGPAVMQDNKIAAFYRDAQINYGSKNILGILAENGGHLVSKRQAVGATDDPVEDSIYKVKGKGLIYTSEAPVLEITENKTTTKYVLKEHMIATAEDKGDYFNLIVKFVVDKKQITIRFMFYISGGNWSLKQVEYVDIPMILDVVGTAPSAPTRFSYACGDSLVFRKGDYSLTLKNIQAQPLLEGATEFSRAYDCTGFMSAPILAGLFVTSILLIVLTIAITAILDIKTPTKFENRHSKPLTFNVQE